VYKQVFIKDKEGAGKGGSVSSAHCLWLPGAGEPSLLHSCPPMMAHLQEAGARDGGHWKEQGQIPRQKKVPSHSPNNRRVWGDLGTDKGRHSTLNPKTSELGQALRKLGVRRD